MRFLERESLQLIKDAQTTKNKLQNARPEINMLCLQDSDNTTLEIKALEGRLASTVSGNQQREFVALRVAKRTPIVKSAMTKKIGAGLASSGVSKSERFSKENADNAISIRPTSETENQLGDARTHHGLGEVLPTNDDNTRECAQS